MKKTATFLFLIATLGLSVQAQDQATFAQASQAAEQRLEKALDEFDKIQAEVNALKPTLGATLDDVEGTALRLRGEASNAARIKAGFDVEVSQLNEERQSVIDTNNYIQSTLLNEYIRRLELTIDPSEIPTYSEKIKAALSLLETDEEIDDETIFEAQLAIVELSLNRLEKVLGGTTFKGSAIVNDTLKDGSFALVGPVSYFADNDGKTVGITTGMKQNRANIYVLEEGKAGITETATSGSGSLPFDTTDGEALIGITESTTLLEEFALGD